MVHPSSHKTPNDISGAVFIFELIWIWIACYLRPVSWSVNICDEYIVLPSTSIAVMSFEIMTGAIVVVDCIARRIFAPESVIANNFLLG